MKFPKEKLSSYRKFIAHAKKLGADSWQRGYHGCGKWSAQAFKGTPAKLVLDWNL